VSYRPFGNHLKKEKENKPSNLQQKVCKKQEANFANDKYEFCMRTWGGGHIEYHKE